MRHMPGTLARRTVALITVFSGMVAAATPSHAAESIPHWDSPARWMAWFQDQTRQEFGVHVGGGVRVPVGPRASLDLGGRYVMLRDQEDPLVPERFDPDFWTADLGLAIRF
jgi:hypothetical protein